MGKVGTDERSPSRTFSVEFRATPTPARIYQYILDFIVSKPTPEEIIAFRPTPEMEERLKSLLERSKVGKITAAESKELDEYERIQHLMIMLKAGVFSQLAS